MVFLFVLASSALFGQKADKIIGKYHLPNNLDISIYKKGKLYFGKIIAVTGEQQTNGNQNPLVGKVIIKDLEYDATTNQWINGTMYAPGKGMTFNLKITDVNDHEIVVVGSKFIMRKTLVWKKIG